MKKKVVVTGGSGFIGTHLIPALLKEGFEVYSVSRSSEAKGAHNIHLDLATTDYGFLDRIDPDYVISLGTVSTPKAAQEDHQACFATNVSSIDRLLNSCKQLNVKKVVLMSTAVLYKDQDKASYSEEDELNTYQDNYNLCKFFMESIAHLYRDRIGLPVTVFRLANSYGYNSREEKYPTLVNQIFRQAIKDHRVEIWNAEPVRDWVYVGDVVKVLVAELGTEESGLYNLGTGIGTDVGTVAKIVAAEAGCEYRVLNKPVTPPFRVVLNVAKLHKHLGFVPSTPIEIGLKETYSDYLASLDRNL